MVVGVGPGAIDQITRNVLDKKLIEWQVGIERSNNIVPVMPWIGCVVIVLVPARFGISDQIEPMATPAFTEVF